MKRRGMFINGICISLLLASACDHMQHSGKIDLNAIAEQLQQAFNAHDAAALAQLYAEDAYYLSPGDPEPTTGREAIEKSHSNFFQAFPDVSTEFAQIFVCGDHIIIEGNTRGTHTGSLPGADGDIPATNRTIAIQFACILKVAEGGLIAEDRTYFDSAVMMRQLGLE